MTIKIWTNQDMKRVYWEGYEAGQLNNIKHLIRLLKLMKPKKKRNNK